MNTEELGTGAFKSTKDDADLRRPAAVSEFWLTTLKNGLSEPIFDQDTVALKYLTGLRIEPSTKPGFNLALNSYQTMFPTRRGREDHVYLEEVSYLGDSVYSWETGTEMKQKGREGFDNGGRNLEAAKTKVSSAFRTSDSSDVRTIKSARTSKTKYIPCALLLSYLTRL